MVLAKGLTAEHTIGATKDSKSIRPFFSYRSISSKRVDLSWVIRAWLSTTMKSLQLKPLPGPSLYSSLSSSTYEKDMVWIQPRSMS